MSETLWAISTYCEQPLPQYIAGCFHPRWKELRAEHDALERELTAALAKAAHMERALEAVIARGYSCPPPEGRQSNCSRHPCRECYKAWALKKAEDAK